MTGAAQAWLAISGVVLFLAILFANAMEREVLRRGSPHVVGPRLPNLSVATAVRRRRRKS